MGSLNIRSDIKYNVSGYEATAEIHPTDDYLEFKAHMHWDPEQTVSFRFEVEVTPVATRRIDVDSLALYNVCPPAAG
jgi:hypothetical protein